MSEQVASINDMQRALNQHLAREPNKVKALHQLTYVAHFNFLRLGYEQFSFADKKRLYQMYMELFPEDGRGDLFDSRFVLECFKQLPKGKTLNVAELGGYQGELARHIIRAYLVNWVSFDIIPHTVPRDIQQSFAEHVLTKELWQTRINLSYVDVFVCMHTLEHFSNTEFEKLISFIIKQKIPHLILQIPLEPEGQSWKNYLGAHVLTYGSVKVKELLMPHYRLVSEVAKGRKIREGWCSFWRLKT